MAACGVAKPAATAVVAHATLAQCHRLSTPGTASGGRRSDSHHILEVELGQFPERFPHPGFSPPICKRLTPRGEPRQKAVVGAVSGTLSDRSTPKVGEAVSPSGFSRKSLHTDDLEAERSVDQRGVLCRARNTPSRRQC